MNQWEYLTRFLEAQVRSEDKEMLQAPLEVDPEALSRVPLTAALTDSPSGQLPEWPDCKHVPEIL